MNKRLLLLKLLLKETNIFYFNLFNKENLVQMKNYLLLFSALIITLAISCVSDDEVIIEPSTTIDLVFKANYGAEPAQMQKEYVYGDADEKDIKFIQMDFFVSNITLMKEISPNSSEIELKEIDFVSLSYTDPNDVAQGYTISIDKVPTGTYAGMKIGIGVPADLNRTKPEDYGSTHVLNKNSHYWEGWTSYIFTKIEAAADLNNDGDIILGGAAGEGLSYHTGTDAVYQEVVIPKDIALTEDVNFTIDLNLDLNQVFQTSNPDHDTNNDGFLDLETFRGTHSEDNLEVAKKIMENLANSITLDF